VILRARNGLQINAVHLDGKAAAAALSAPVRLPSGGGALAWVDAALALRACPPTSCVLVSAVTDRARLSQLLVISDH
jgi:hypothetical protein